MTSKEQAEEILEQLATDQYGGNTDNFFREEKEQYKDYIKSRIPLTELLEVAKAADAWCNKERFDEWEGQMLRVKMNEAITALRATGKVKL